MQIDEQRRKTPPATFIYKKILLITKKIVTSIVALADFQKSVHLL